MVEILFETFQNSGKKQFLAAILANIGLRISQADLGLDAAQFRVLHTLCSTKSTTASWTLDVASSLGAPTPIWCTALTLRPVVCGGRRTGLCSKHVRRLVCRKLRQKLSIVSRRAKNRILRECDRRPQDNTSNLSRPRASIEMNSSALSPTLMWPCLERRGVTMGCLYLEIEGQSCLVGSVDYGLMKNRQTDLLDRMTKKRAKK